jgi:hypothetical protein
MVFGSLLPRHRGPDEEAAQMPKGLGGQAARRPALQGDGNDIGGSRKCELRKCSTDDVRRADSIA